MFCESYVASSDEDYNSGLRYMPLGMEKMTCLMEFNKFILGNSSMKREVRFEGLRVSRNIRGSLEIYISSNYKHYKECGGGGYLCNTQYLKSIFIDFPYGNLGDERMGKDDVLDDLQPHNNLKELTIMYYRRLTIPQWAREDGLATSLPNLVKIVIGNCDGLKELPWMGKLQHLKTLELLWLENLEYMENKTWRTNIGSSSEGAMSSSMAVEIFFPSLENLKLYYLPKLKGWWRGSLGSGMRDGVIKGGQRSPLFPRLSQVRIEDCPDLRFIPLGRVFEILLLKNSGIMEEDEDQKVMGGTSSNDSGNSVSNDANIKQIETTNIRSEEVFRSCSSSLRFLEAKNCEKLKSVSRGSEHLTVLESLELADLPELRFDETQGEEEEEDDARGNDVPEWIHCLSSLQSLEITYCKQLESFPKALWKLTSLKRLQLESCTKILYERCKEPNGEYWPIIQHISNIKNLVCDSDSE
ncbi:hypothetical protein Cgig2_001836 [Carnegiea gigantea]|uniref:R13L1/DRL21-like LRR repeat region domain-containing protein n=1 Tax=Carnegiea gigantea TaxID=171969 RepID=A0A9Q1JZY8_9CARY|nr:hypothetical protein Cgig2_001836 [Carnegiea gigantea]